MKKLLLGFLLCSVGFGATADWKYSEKVDEMRGTTQYLASLVPEKEDEGVAMTLIAEGYKNKEAYNFHFSLNGAEFDCKVGEICSGFMKADNGQIKELLFEIDKKNQLLGFVIGMGSFAKELSGAKTLYVELPILDKGMMQFKYEPNKLKWSM
ncbi:hypothetical protein [Providencia sp.]|uniref:hypothetical protein n=1 Tax=Providencia sp. TaxID=589 RepID=UPI003F9C2FC7